jgi:peptidoglycan/LPS O-acetylase OafA/YrhL
MPKVAPPPLIKFEELVNMGGTGVMFFFVISGFLITWLMLKEHQIAGRINLRHFYMRRALRILPVYFAYLLILAFVTNYQQDPTYWLANLTFTTNFHIPPFATAHLWSLALEEQFYLIWPCLLVFLPNEQPMRLLKCLSVAVIIAPVLRIIGCKNWYPENLHFLFQWGSFFTRFDCLAYGCIAAVLYSFKRETCAVFFVEKTKFSPTFLGLVAILVPSVLKLAHAPARIQAACGDTFVSIGFMFLLLHSIMNPSLPVYRWLNWKWVSHLGVLSYSIYIWQQMFCGTSKTVFGMADAWWTHFPVWILCALLAAHASYYLLEKPLLGLRAKFR